MQNVYFYMINIYINQNVNNNGHFDKKSHPIYQASSLILGPVLTMSVNTNRQYSDCYNITIIMLMCA